MWENLKAQEECPPWLPGVQSFGISKVGQVLMICPDQEWLDRTLQPVSAFLFHSSYFKVHFYWGEPLTEEGAGIELVVSWIMLEENHPNCESESVIVQPSV